MMMLGSRSLGKVTNQELALNDVKARKTANVYCDLPRNTLNPWYLEAGRVFFFFFLMVL